MYAQALAIRLPRRALLTALLLVLIIVSASMSTYRQLGKGDRQVEPQSVRIAEQMLSLDCCGSHGTEEAPKQGNAPPYSVGPGYALVLFSIAKIDAGVRTAIRCETLGPNCRQQGSFTRVVLVQLAVAVLGMALVFGTSWRVSGSWEVAMLTLILVFLVSRLGDHSALLYPAVWPPFFAYLAMYLTVEALARSNLLFGLGAGLAIGAASLFMPLWLILAPTTAAALALAPSLQGQWLRGIALGTALLIGTACAWLLVLYAQSLSYDPASLVRLLTVQLSERAAFQAMELKAWLASLILPVPLIGGLGELLFGEETVRLFGLWTPGSYALTGGTVIYRDALAHAQTPFDQYLWVVNTYIVEQAGSFLSTTVSIVNRGIWAGAGLIGLAGLFLLRPMLVRQASDGRLAALAVVAFPVVVLFALQALLTANHPFNNPGLPFLYCYAIAYVSARL